MPKIKDSGIEWIGEIPEDWEIKRLKAVLCERNENNNPIKTNYILSLTNDRGVIPYDEKGDIGNKSKEDVSGYKLAYPNDIVLNSMNVVIGSVALSQYYGCVSPVYYMLFPRNSEDCVRYYNYIFQTKQFQGKLKGYGNGIMEIRMRIQMSKLNTVELPIPDSETQSRIAEYLDDKCGKIDRYIEKQQQVIEKLKAYKQAIIAEAVTKGLDPTVPMKDSGIEWIGMIPEHWKITKMKYIGRFINGYAFPSNAFVSSGIRVMKIANIQPMNISWVEESFVNEEYNSLTDYQVEKGDVVFALTRPIINGGIKTAIADFDDFVLLNQRNAMYKGNKFLSNRWQYYSMQSSMFVQEFEKYIDGTGQQPNISTNEIANIFVPIPSIEEQMKITTYLDNQCQKIDSTIFNKQKIIEKLTEYKKSLIYEAVTGKVEV